MKIQLTESEVKELLNNDLLYDISEHGGKHDCTDKFQRFERDGKWFGITLSYSYNEGLQLYGNTVAEEIREVEKTVKVWEVVK